MAICALARNNERTLGFDYLGVIVGVLALLVTFLVGWQIYTTIGLTHKISDAERRIEIGETRIKNMLHNLERVKSDIEITSKSTNDMIIGTVNLSSALSLFHNTSIDNNQSDELKIANYIQCYILSAGAMARFMNIPNDSDMRTVFNKACLQILKQSGEEIFKEDKKDLVNTIFFEERHLKCDKYYLDIMKQFSKLDKEQQKIIETNHSKRRLASND